ncbi:lysophospholipid acyltransferase 7-like [Tropilaelaps mercedesae]|uniref:Lysophospholipid acyltransferase 7 n=1 Tax=Tropilaelaps mercedesae TaxID=418985 RepID=A0A1V9XDI6_9ACAR|nr:lysophospholipid acyltransferase 7-like [Tropilaelaps mercedesae]
MKDEFFYAGFLSGHIAFGALYMDKIPLAQRRSVCSLIGLATSVLLMGWDFLHQLALTLATIVIIVLHRRTKAFSLCGALNCICFGHLFYFRFYCENNFSNMIMMLLVLRMAGLGWELCDSGPRDDSTPMHVSVQDIVHYSFSYIGLLAGPYIRFRTFMDFMDGVCPTTFDERRHFLMARLLKFPLFSMVFIASLVIAPVEPAKTIEFHDQAGFLYTIWYMLAMFAGFRSRLYGGFVLAECSCIASGMGAYPEHWINRSGEGPTRRKMFSDFDSDNRKESEPSCGDRTCSNESFQREAEAIDFETVVNFDAWGCESAPTIKETMRAWNKTVQYWLAVNCYKRVPFRSRAVRMAVTLAVSAFWHGVSPGYYLCFITMVFFATAEDYIVTHFSDRSSFVVPTGLVGRLLFAQIKMAVFAYLGIAFVMVRLPEILQFYWNLYFIGHLAVIVILAYFTVTLNKVKRATD